MSQDPNFWVRQVRRYRMLAEEMRTIAEETRSPVARVTREIIADDYERLALSAARRHNIAQEVHLQDLHRGS